ncbi:MAG: CidA/LrgA family protein [Devosia sp.]|nr:CidA/LrgA family protein [Devosia sp.]
MTENDETRVPRPPSSAVEVLFGFAMLLTCQLAGEVLVQLLHMLTQNTLFPGPVAGLMILLAVMVLRRDISPGVAKAGDGLIGVLSLLFVPSAVGIIRYGDLLVDWGVVLVIAVIVSTLLTLLATVGTYLWLSARYGGGEV